MNRDVTPRAVPPVTARLLVMRLRAAEEHVLVVVGEADISTADELRDRLLAALVGLAGHPPALRVELGGLEFCDLRGLGALHVAERAAADRGVHLTFSGMSAQLAWLQRTFPSGGAPPRPAGPGAAPGSAVPERYRAGAGGPRTAPDGLVHAVPHLDTTRSAVCGVRVRPSPALWDEDLRGCCPDCTRLVERTAARVSRVAPGQPRLHTSRPDVRPVDAPLHATAS